VGDYQDDVKTHPSSRPFLRATSSAKKDGRGTPFCRRDIVNGPTARSDHRSGSRTVVGTNSELVPASNISSRTLCGKGDPSQKQNPLSCEKVTLVISSASSGRALAWLPPATAVRYCFRPFLLSAEIGTPKITHERGARGRPRQPTASFVPRASPCPVGCTLLLAGANRRDSTLNRHPD